MTTAFQDTAFQKSPAFQIDTVTLVISKDEVTVVFNTFQGISFQHTGT